MRLCLIIVFVLLLLCDLYLIKSHPERMTVSVIDGNAYSVKKRFEDHQKASNILARLNSINKTIIDHMRKKYEGTDDEDGVSFLIENYNGNVLSEHTPKSTVNTSYVLNKGDLIKICLRDPSTKEFHDFQTILFVNLHELSHLLDREYGHNKSFWGSFAVILNEAVELGIYKPRNYRIEPVNYCGLTISSSPLYSKIVGDDEM